MGPVFFLYCVPGVGKIVDEEYASGVDNFNYSMYEISDKTYLTALRIVTSFVDVLQPTQLLLIRKGMFRYYYDATSDRSKTSRYKKFVEDKILLLELFTEFVTINRVVTDYPVEDEFIWGMKELDKTRKVPFYLVFAAQIFLDIHHIQWDRAEMAFHYFIRDAQVMVLASHFDYHKDFKVANWIASNDQYLRERKLKVIIADPVYQAKPKYYHRMGSGVPETLQPHRILRHSLAIPGLLFYHFRYHFYDIGISLTYATGSLTYMTHL